MIVTLAGHVDHGKTSLVEALTGVNTDTLAEERRRGLTIDLGFSYTDIAGRRIGFVDVPGHHRFIHNMVAGVAAHQHALLVVAADDGPCRKRWSISRCCVCSESHAASPR
jgi:selenocysteine-specific elongation factor